VIRRARALLSVVLLSTPAAAEPLDEVLYARILVHHTREVADTAGTRVDYPGLARSPAWTQLLANLGRTRPLGLSTRAERIAYWLNAYNIFAMDLVVRNQPRRSIRDVGSLFRPVWKREAGRIHGRPYSLDEIEHEILRALGEPRVHAGIVCASVSCPALRREPWTAAHLEAQFDDTLRRWLSNPEKGLAVDRAGNRVRLSRIFDWFEEDFEAAGGVLAFVARYASDADREWLERNGAGAAVEYLDYDWGLNGLAGMPSGG
jgi:hypothetical protein